MIKELEKLGYVTKYIGFQEDIKVLVFTKEGTLVSWFWLNTDSRTIFGCQFNGTIKDIKKIIRILEQYEESEAN